MGSAGALPGCPRQEVCRGTSRPEVPRQYPGSAPAVPALREPTAALKENTGERQGAPARQTRQGRRHHASRQDRAEKTRGRCAFDGSISKSYLTPKLAWHNAHDGTTHDPPRAGQRLARRVAAVDRGQRRAGVHAATTQYRQVSLRLARPARSSDSERWRETVARALLARSCAVHGAHRKPQRLRTAGRRLIRSTPSRSACSSTSQRS